MTPITDVESIQVRSTARLIKIKVITFLSFALDDSNWEQQLATSAKTLILTIDWVLSFQQVQVVLLQRAHH